MLLEAQSVYVQYVTVLQYSSGLFLNTYTPKLCVCVVGGCVRSGPVVWGWFGVWSAFVVCICLYMWVSVSAKSHNADNIWWWS